MTSTKSLKVTSQDLQRLTEVLWSWSICSGCLNAKSCTASGCPWTSRSKTLSVYFEFYRKQIQSYECAGVESQLRSLQSHEDLLRIVKLLQENFGKTRSHILSLTVTPSIRNEDQERALDLAVRVMLMTRSADARQSEVLAEHGDQQLSWQADVTFSDFMMKAFPMKPQPQIEQLRKDIRAISLLRIAKLSIEATDNVRNHLRIDRARGVVQIFHHTSFLREQLRRTRNIPDELSMQESLKLGVLPRVMALEILDTLHTILFPRRDPKSQAFLESLTTKKGGQFDPNVLETELSTIRDPSEPNSLSYSYFGQRLADLQAEINEPAAHGFEKWFQRKSTPRYVMMATLAGVCFAIVLGLLALGLSGLQAWIAWQQWKHPVSQGV